MMKLDQGLAQNLAMDAKQSQAFAGGLLLFFEEILKRRGDADLVSALRAAIPELAEWQTHALTLPVGAVTAQAIVANAGSEAGEFNLLMMSHSVAPEAHAVVKKLVLGFLAERMGSAAIERLRAATDLLSS